MKINILLRNVNAALARVHVLGADAELLAGAMRSINNCVDAIEKVQREEIENENHDEQGQDV
jgi:hypothetical protein